MPQEWAVVGPRPKYGVDQAGQEPRTTRDRVDLLGPRRVVQVRDPCVDERGGWVGGQVVERSERVHAVH